MVKIILKKSFLPIVVFAFWSSVIIRWTEGFSGFTTYSAALSRAGELPRMAPNFKLISMDNKKIDLNNFKGKYTLIEFMYLHCPTVCGILRARLYDFYPLLKNEIEKNLVLLSISFDPERDTSEILKQSWQSLGNKKNWNFAGFDAQHYGSSEEIKLQLEKFGFIIYQDPKTLDFNHTALFFLLNPEGEVIAALNPSLEVHENILKIRQYLN